MNSVGRTRQRIRLTSGTVFAVAALVKLAAEDGWIDEMRSAPGEFDDGQRYWAAARGKNPALAVHVL